MIRRDPDCPTVPVDVSRVGPSLEGLPEVRRVERPVFRENRLLAPDEGHPMGRKREGKRRII